MIEKEIKKTIPCTIATQRIIYLKINVTKEVKDLYTKNYKASKKEIKKHTQINGKTSVCIDTKN